MSQSATEGAAPDLNAPGNTASTGSAASQTAGQAAPEGTQGQGAQGAQQATSAAQQANDGQGKGGADALRADLAKERDARQAMETKFSTFMDGIGKALGLKTEEVTPDQLKQQLEQAQATGGETATQLAVFRNTPDGVDANALLDSNSFLASLKGVAATDTAKITELITKAVEADKTGRFKAHTAGGGSGDAGAGKPPSGAATMNDWIRGGGNTRG